MIKRKPYWDSSTRLELMMSEDTQVILDGLVPGAYSNKAILQFVIVNKAPYVFKYPTLPSYANIIIKDFEFCERLKRANGNILPRGIVEYRRLCILNKDKQEIIGSISKVYCFSLSQLCKPLPSSFVSELGFHLVDVVEEVHALGFVINDIKPENIFMGVDVSIDIGDFGGATSTGDVLFETTDDYYPIDLRECRYAYPVGDWMCLVNTIFELLGNRKGNTSTEIRTLIGSYNDFEDIKKLLGVLSSKF